MCFFAFSHRVDKTAPDCFHLGLSSRMNARHAHEVPDHRVIAEHVCRETVNQEQSLD